MSAGSALASSVRLNQPNQFASSSSPWTRTASKPAASACALEVAGHEGVHVDDRLERVVLAAAVVVAGRRGPRAHGAPPGRRQPQRGALGDRRDPVAVARRLAREEQRPAGREHAHELGEGAVEVGQVVEHGVAEHEVEAVVLERQLGGVAGGGLDLQARAPPRCARASRACRARCRCRWPSRSRRPASG